MGEASRAAGDDASVMVMSDHGAGPLHEFIHANNLLLAHGMLKVKRRPALAGSSACSSGPGLTPLNVYRFGAALNLGTACAWA